MSRGALELQPENEYGGIPFTPKPVTWKKTKHIQNIIIIIIFKTCTSLTKRNSTCTLHTGLHTGFISWQVFKKQDGTARRKLAYALLWRKWNETGI